MVLANLFQPKPRNILIREKNALQLSTLDRLAKKLRAARFKNGAVGFDREELHFDVEEKGGKPVSC